MCDVGKELDNAANSISAHLGTDGSNNGLLPGVSNALGTDGSKNGLLNDPITQAAAIAAAAYFTGGGNLVADFGTGAGAAGAEAGTAAAAGEGFSLAASDGAFNAALASSTAADTAVAAGGSSGFWAGLGSTAAGVGKAVLPSLILGGLNGGKQQQIPNYLPRNYGMPQSYGVPMNYGLPQSYGVSGNYGAPASSGSSGMLTLLLIAAVGIMLLKR